MQIQEYHRQDDQRQWQEERRYVRVKVGRWAVRWPSDTTIVVLRESFAPVNPQRRLVWNVAERRPEIR